MEILPKLTDKEMEKWLKILGAESLLVLHIDNKIHLSNKQLKTYFGIEVKKGVKDGRNGKAYRSN